MLGAILGDIIGSPYEFESGKTKDFELFMPNSRLTDDSIITMAVGYACAEANCYDEDSFKEILIEKMCEFVQMYPQAGYGEMFFQWAHSKDKEPYGGYANGAAMRVSPTAWAMHRLEDVERLAKWSAEVTHDHPDGIKGAQSVAAAIFLARTGSTKEEIKRYISDHYYDLDFELDNIREGYQIDMRCEHSVPEAIVCFLESDSFEDAIRNAISLGGDGDTQAAIAGSIAEAFYGIPEELQEVAFEYMDEIQQECVMGYLDILQGE